ncbi:hypothetical protein SARC_11481 [Sphaeroforma arctica JP610]|uniref:RRM domain-containing protein n=1 Tax=Sphaeroforma arctica JP610 TaxID=667725 RepID=A0A0L0FJ02_9EUKA|nr:hypothetical protein SARC_11481 [Sphaeroforma arctica JP610]KNC76008.1 hypothetical protein SARC_11481 [Sphaeroforma arctica JP610]|eukprot:XP_014149910.1 hypothetical protein SARC_11481 [Sphaeroforma arctica JP610]
MSTISAGVSDTVNDDELKARFNSFGQVTDVHIAVDTLTNTRRGFAYVQMECTNASLKRCMSLLNGTRWKGKELHLALARPRFVSTLQKEIDHRKKQEQTLQDEREREARGEIVHPVVEPVVMGIKLAKKSHGWKLAGRQGRPVAVMKMYNPYKRRIIVMDPTDNVRSAVRYHQPSQSNTNSISMGGRRKISKPLRETEETPEYLSRIEKTIIDEKRMLRSIAENIGKTGEGSTHTTGQDDAPTQTQIQSQTQSHAAKNVPSNETQKVNTQKENRELRSAAAKACANVMGDDTDDPVVDEKADTYVTFDDVDADTYMDVAITTAVDKEEKCYLMSSTADTEDIVASELDDTATSAKMNSSPTKCEATQPADVVNEPTITDEEPLSEVGDEAQPENICSNVADSMEDDVLREQVVCETAQESVHLSNLDTAKSTAYEASESVDALNAPAPNQEEGLASQSLSMGDGKMPGDDTAVPLSCDKDEGKTGSEVADVSEDSIISDKSSQIAVDEDTDRTDKVAAIGPAKHAMLLDDDNDVDSEPDLPGEDAAADAREDTDPQPTYDARDTGCAISQVDGADDKANSRSRKHTTRPKRQKDKNTDTQPSDESAAKTKKKHLANERRLESLKALRETSKLAQPIKISADAPSNNKNKIRFDDSEDEDMAGDDENDNAASVNRKRKREKKQKRKEKENAKAKRAVAADFMGIGGHSESDEGVQNSVDGNGKRSEKDKRKKRRQEDTESGEGGVKGDGKRSRGKEGTEPFGDNDDGSHSDSSDVPTKTQGLPGVDSSDDNGGDSEDDVGSDAERFAIKPVFEGKGGAELLELKRRYQGDERFQLDSRFIEDESSSSDSESESERGTIGTENATDEPNEEVGMGMRDVAGVRKIELKAERANNKKILESLLGVGVGKKYMQSDARDFEEGFGDEMETGRVDDDEVVRNEKEINKKHFVDMRTMHYDPTNEDMTALLDAKEEEEAPSKKVKRGDEEDHYDKPKAESAALPEVSKEKAFAVHVTAMADYFKMKVPESEVPVGSGTGASMTVGGVEIIDGDDDETVDEKLTTGSSGRDNELEKNENTGFSLGDSFGFGFGADSRDEDEDMDADVETSAQPTQAGSFNLGAILGIKTDYNPDDEDSNVENMSDRTSGDSSESESDAERTFPRKTAVKSNEIKSAKVSTKFGDSTVVAGVNTSVVSQPGERSLLFKWAMPTVAVDSDAGVEGAETADSEQTTSLTGAGKLPALFMRTDTLDVVKKRWMDRREQLTKEFKSKRKGNLRRVKKGGSNNFSRN